MGGVLRVTSFMNAVDTNILIYAHDADEPAKQAVANVLLAELVQKGETVLLWQVAGELLSCLRRWQSEAKITAADVQANFHDVLAMFPLQIPTRKAFDVSFDLSARFSLSHWDSMLLAACKEAGASTLYSEDMDAGTDYDGVRIVNPFGS